MLALIPAKGASTRLKRKNVAKLGGRPLIAWTIDAAKQADVFDRIVVSTEDAEIAATAREAGAEAPFVRPSDLATDPAGVVQVALHALDELEKAGENFDEICILLPTCPFRSAQDIIDAVALFRSRSENNLMSVGPFEHTPFGAVGIDDDGIAAPFFPEFFGRKSQEMPRAFRPNGAIHVLNVAWFREKRSYIEHPVIAFQMPRDRSHDIDTREDLAVAEAMLASGKA